MLNRPRHRRGVGPRPSEPPPRWASRSVRGMEISTRLPGPGVHLLAYLPDPTYPPAGARCSTDDPGRPQRPGARDAAPKLQATGRRDHRARRTPRAAARRAATGPAARGRRDDRGRRRRPARARPSPVRSARAGPPYVDRVRRTPRGGGPASGTAAAPWSSSAAAHPSAAVRRVRAPDRRRDGWPCLGLAGTALLDRQDDPVAGPLRSCAAVAAATRAHGRRGRRQRGRRTWARSTTAVVVAPRPRHRAARAAPAPQPATPRAPAGGRPPAPLVPAAGAP